MAELGIIASVIQIADVGLRLSIKLYTFGEIVASADRSVISISKDVSLTSGVLKELGQTLDKDRETRTFSANAVQTANGVVQECLEVFEEMEDILVKRLPHLGIGKEGKGERVKRATVMLERLRWSYLQPKLQLLRSNLDRLKSTLLLMLNVITYARQVSEKVDSPSVIAEQRSLINVLAHSNQEYIRKFEDSRLRIGGPPTGRVDDDASHNRAVERESNTAAKSPPGEKMTFASDHTLLQEEENPRSPASKEFATTPRLRPKAEGHVRGSPATPLSTDMNTAFINTSVQTNIAMPPVQDRGIPTMNAPTELGQETLLKQLEHYSMLINNLLKEVDETQYKISFKSRLRMKGGIAGLHESERRELEKTWGGTALQSAEQRLDSLVEGLGELPRMNQFAVRDRINRFSNRNIRREGQSPSVAIGGSIVHFNEVTGLEDRPETPLLVQRPAAKETTIIGAPKINTSHYVSSKRITKTSDNFMRERLPLPPRKISVKPIQGLGLQSSVSSRNESRISTMPPHGEDSPVIAPQLSKNSFQMSSTPFGHRAKNRGTIKLPWGLRIRRMFSRRISGPKQTLDPLNLSTDSKPGDSIFERPFQVESEQGDSKPADMEAVDRLVSLWTTVKPL